MKITIISNGGIKLVFSPETAIEKETIKEFKGKEVSLKCYDQPTQILDTPAPDAMVLSVKDIKARVLTEIFVIASLEHNTFIDLHTNNEVEEIKQKLKRIFNQEVTFNKNDNLYTVNEMRYHVIHQML